jgi:RNA polymerase sigma-70 factor (ECF subfamily)
MEEMSNPIENVARQWSLVQPSVAMFIRSVVPDIHDSQDVLQEVAAAVFSHDFARSQPDSFNAWVIGIARYKALDFYRRKGDRRAPVLIDANILDQLASSTELISGQIEVQREALQRCMEAMPGKSRRLLELRYQLNLPLEEIAAQSRVGLSAIKMSLHRIRLALRNCIDRQLRSAASVEGDR